MTKVALVHDSVQKYRRPLFDVINDEYDTTFFLGDQRTAPDEYQTQSWNALNIIRSLRNSDYDVVIAPEYTQRAAWWAFIGGRINDTPIIQWTEIWNKPEWDFPTRTAASILLRTANKFVNGYVVPGNPHARWIIKNTLRGVNEIKIAPNATHISSKGFREKDDSTPPKILYFGQVIPRKGVDILVEAVGEIEQEVELIICGGGDDEYRETLNEKAKNLGVPLDMREWIPDAEVMGVYQEGDIYAILSRADPAPISVVEAMQAGNPVVASKTVGCAEDLIRGKGSGYVVPPESPEATSKALTKLLDPRRRRKMGKRAYKIATNVATTERMFEVFDDAITSAISEQ